jgi:hypothetical protein
VVAFFEVLDGGLKKEKKIERKYIGRYYGICLNRLRSLRVGVGQFIVSECVIPPTSESISSLLSDSWYSSSWIVL